MKPHSLRTVAEAVEVHSNQVIGEAYIVLQHHYGIPAPDARSALAVVLTSGLVAPLNGQSVILALRSSGGPRPLRQAYCGQILVRGPGDPYAGQTDGDASQRTQAVR